MKAGASRRNPTRDLSPRVSLPARPSVCRAKQSTEVKQQMDTAVVSTDEVARQIVGGERRPSFPRFVASPDYASVAELRESGENDGL